MTAGLFIVWLELKHSGVRSLCVVAADESDLARQPGRASQDSSDR
jgi:hypothetical protein